MRPVCSSYPARWATSSRSAPSSHSPRTLSSQTPAPTSSAGNSHSQPAYRLQAESPLQTGKPAASPPSAAASLSLLSHLMLTISPSPTFKTTPSSAATSTPAPPASSLSKTPSPGPSCPSLTAAPSPPGPAPRTHLSYSTSTAHACGKPWRRARER